jgi:hypothetical protein
MDLDMDKVGAFAQHVAGALIGAATTAMVVVAATARRTRPPGRLRHPRPQRRPPVRAHHGHPMALPRAQGPLSNLRRRAHQPHHSTRRCPTPGEEARAGLADDATASILTERDRS